MPAPPIPTNQSSPTGEAACKRDQLLGDDLRGVGAGEARHRLGPSPEAEPGAASSSPTCDRRSSPGSGTSNAPPPRSNQRAFFVWWSAVAYGYGTSSAGCAAAAISQTTPPARETTRSAAASAAPKSSVNGRSRYAGAAAPRRRELGVVALAGEVQHGRARPRRTPRSRPRSAAARRGCRRRRARPARRAGDRTRPRASPGCRGGTRASDGDRPAHDAVLGPVPSRDRIGEEDARGERGGEPVRETEVRVGLGQRGRDPPAGRGQRPSGRRRSRRRRERRPAAAARGSDRRRPGRRRRSRSGAECGGARRPRDAPDRKGVELVARGRHEPRLGPVRRAGEADAHAAFGERLRHGERGQDVSRRPPGRDQAPKLRCCAPSFLAMLRRMPTDGEADDQARCRRRTRTEAGCRSAARGP